METLLCFAAAIYCFYETVSLASTSLWLDKWFVFIAPSSKASMSGEQPYCDPWRRFLRWELKGFTRTNQQLHSHEKSSNATQVERGQKRPFCKATWKYYDCVHKAFTHFDRHSWLNKEALSALPKEVVTPVEKRAPTNELISDMNCGVYVRVFRCTAHSFPSLLWAEFKGETAYCTWTHRREFFNRDSIVRLHQIISHFPRRLISLHADIMNLDRKI